MSVSVAVVGAGVVGLTTALHVQELLPNVQVTVIADKFNTHTTSDGAAGMFLPDRNFKGPEPTSAKEWVKYSYGYYNNLISENCGVCQMPGYTVSREDMVLNPLVDGVLPEYRFATNEEIAKFPGDWKHGTFMRTLVITCRTFLPWLANKIQSKGGKLVQKKINSFSDLNEYNVIVNCTGLQSRFLCDDDQVVPIRGQVIKVRSPYHQIVNSSGTYVIPSGDGLVTLGGTHQRGDWNTEVSVSDGKGIWERCTSLAPEIASSTKEWEWVGLRPYRETVRVEKEIKNNIKLVHNYGHGGYGVTTAPGTARDAALLVKLMLE